MIVSIEVIRLLYQGSVRDRGCASNVRLIQETATDFTSPRKYSGWFRCDTSCNHLKHKLPALLQSLEPLLQESFRGWQGSWPTL
jgi:hypothetical protein